jgi:hypothetical protein
MNTSLIRKIITSDLPRKEQDILILLVVDYNTIDQKKIKLDEYYETECIETEHSSDCGSDSKSVQDNEPDSDSENELNNKSDISTVKPEKNYNCDHYDNRTGCDDCGYNKAMRRQYHARHGHIMSHREIEAEADAEKSISRDDSNTWGLQFPSNSIWGNWVYSYSKDTDK